MEEHGRVLLAYMPFGLIQIAPLGLSLLKAALTRAGVACDIRYFNLEFVDSCLTGSPDTRARVYTRMTTRYQLTFSAEARVAELLFGRDDERSRVVSGHIARALPDEQALLAVLPERFDRFLRTCVETIDWNRYRVLGLSSVFLGMTVPSLLLAREVKRQFPHVVTVLGGPNTEGTMGEVIARRFPQIDYVLRGEADDTWPRLVDAILADRSPGPLPGLVRRGIDGAIDAWPMRPIDRMDTLPIPDFDDFISAASRSLLAARYRTRLQLPFESSRGCWWGQKSHCKFCGINGQGMGYRAKSRDRLLDEIESLTTRYRPHALVATDAILDRGYFGTVLPALATRRAGVTFSYEVKANVTRSQMEEMRDAGIREILPGIETFSTRLLKLMKKGATAFDNLICLRLAEECDIKVSWYHMCGLPQERMEDYDKDIATIRRVPHLQPPREIARFTLQRFTPYLEQAQTEGLARVRPMTEYRAVFPLADEDLRDLAYHFEFDFADGRPADLTREIEDKLEAAISEWRTRYGRVSLVVIHGEDGALMIDTRQSHPRVYVLDAMAAKLYGELERPHSSHTLLGLLQSLMREACEDNSEDKSSHLDEWLGDRAVLSSLWADAKRLSVTLDADVISVTRPRLSEQALRSWLDALAACDLLYDEDGRFLALAVRRSREWFAAHYSDRTADVAV
jgi:ribosomal peptide maturation radical SAM protein 1